MLLQDNFSNGVYGKHGKQYLHKANTMVIDKEMSDRPPAAGYVKNALKSRILISPDGNITNPRIIILGEKPNAEEFRFKRPFVGPSGKNLKNLLGIPLESSDRRKLRILITNINGMTPPFIKTFKTCLKPRGRKRILLILGKAAWLGFLKNFKNWPLNWDIIAAPHPSPRDINRYPHNKKILKTIGKFLGLKGARKKHISTKNKRA